MAISIDASSGWIPDGRWLDGQQLHVLDELLRWARRDTPNENNHWVQGFAGSGKTILIVYAMHQTMELLRNEASHKKVCFIAYTHSLKGLVLSAFQSKDGDDIPVYTFDEFGSIPREEGNFDFVFVDEAQDIQQKHLRLLKERCNKIVLAGDPQQSIFTKALPTESISANLNVPRQNLHYLSILYRLPRPVVEFADKILADTGMVQADNGRTGSDGTFVVNRFGCPEDEAKMIFTTANQLAVPQAPSLIIFPQHRDVRPFVGERLSASSGTLRVVHRCWHR